MTLEDVLLRLYALLWLYVSLRPYVLLLLYVLLPRMVGDMDVSSVGGEWPPSMLGGFAPFWAASNSCLTWVAKKDAG